MKLDIAKNIPKTVAIECPSCGHTGHSKNSNDITVCGSCGLELHKDELIELNKEKIISKIDTKKIGEDLVKQLTKGFKKFK